MMHLKGGNIIVPVGSEQLPAYLVAPEWQKRHVALIALAQIAEGCLKVMCSLEMSTFLVACFAFYISKLQLEYLW